MSEGFPTTCAANGAPPAEAAVLYAGEVMHARMKPVPHRFTYQVLTVLLDLDRLEEANRASPLFSIDRPNLVSVNARDHGPRDGSPLAPHARALIAEATGLEAGTIRRVFMLAYPRLFGQVFNPLTVYFAYADGEAPVGILYEVRNTFGGMHTYALPVADGELSAGGIRQRRAKSFFVSPFIEMEETYAFRLLPPGEGVRVRILETDREGPILSATFAGRRRPLTTRALAAALGEQRFFPFKVIGAIHVEAVRLLAKGIKGLPIPREAKRTTWSVGAGAVHGDAKTITQQPQGEGRLEHG